MNSLLILFAFALFATSAFAQAVPALPRLAWDQAAPTLAEAKSYAYRMYRNGSTYPIPLLNVICEAPRPTTTAGAFHCSAAFPASLPGPTKIVVTATQKKTESPKSNVLAYNFQPIP